MKAMILSLGLHGTVIFLVFALSSSLAQQDKPIVIDFNFVEPSDPPTPPTASPQKEANSPVIAKAIPFPYPPKQRSAPPQSGIETREHAAGNSEPRGIRPGTFGTVIIRDSDDNEWRLRYNRRQPNRGKQRHGQLRRKAVQQIPG
jgi:hypothetical protein